MLLELYNGIDDSANVCFLGDVVSRNNRGESRGKHLARQKFGFTSWNQ